MSQDSVPTNYNDKGTVIMEMIYGDEYLSPGGAAKTQALIDLAGLKQGLNILDVGSGLGGSAFYLAQHQGARVQGIDLMGANVAEAHRRAHEKVLLDQVQFVAGDAIALPFSDQSFDVVWGQDAWCHIANKADLVAELKRVLVDDGQVVFSDWIVTNPEHPGVSALYEVTASPNMATLRQYEILLHEHGLSLQVRVDTSGELLEEYQLVIERLVRSQKVVVERYGQRVFDIVLGKQQSVLSACEEGLLGSGAFVASAP